MKWTDIRDIAIELSDSFPEYDPLQINFVELQRKVTGLPEFNDNPDGCNERILEAIQMAWLEEID